MERLSGPITGFVDYAPEAQCQFNTFLERIRVAYERFGFTPLHLRPFEKMAALQGEGETSKQIFEVFRADTGKTTGMALPFDHTVPLALWVAEHAGHRQHLPLPYKRYDLGLVYRGERAKTGRLRAFVQADVDIVGRKLGLGADAECISAIYEALDSLDVGEFQMHINHIGVVHSILRMHGVEEEVGGAVLRAVDKLDKLSKEDVAKEIDKAAPEVDVEALLETFMAKRSLDDPNVYGPEATPFLEEMRTLRELLITAGMPASTLQFSPHMVRGLAYYTGIVFETHLVGYESYGSMASGGRYSHLVGDFAKGLSDIEGVGGSIGLSRLFDVLLKTDYKMPSRKSIARVLVAARSSELASKSYEMARELRQLGLSVDTYAGPYKIKNALSHAAALGVEHAVLVMDAEAIVVKEMQSGEQHELDSVDSVCSYFKG